MSDPFRTLQDYEIFLYTLPERFPSIRRSTLTLVSRGHSLALQVSPLKNSSPFPAT
jgi:hypothetical protein